MQIFGSGEGNNVARLGADVKENWFFDEGEEEVGSFGVDLVFDTGQSGEFDGAVTGFHYETQGLDH